MLHEKLEDHTINSLRGMGFVFGVLSYLQDDPICSRCRSFLDSVDAAKDKFLVVEKSVTENKYRTEETRTQLSRIYTVLADLNIPDNPIRQKRNGKCKFPEGVCLAKLTLAIYEKIKG